MALTPMIIGAAPKLVGRLVRHAPVASTLLESDRSTLEDHVVILGYGMGGQLVAESLTELSVPYVALELNGATVRSGRTRGVNIHYADVSAPEPLEAAGVTKAAAVVAMLSDPDASERAIRSVRSLSTTVPIIARTRYRREAERLLRAGATLAVAEELEASLEVLSQLLARLHMPGNVVETLVESYRRALGVTTARGSRSPAIPLDQLPREIFDAPVSSFRLLPEGWAVGRTLQELDLRVRTSATVLAVRRRDRTVTSPHGAFRLEANDDIFLLGDDSDVLLTRALLERGPRGAGDTGSGGTGSSGPGRMGPGSAGTGVM
jgi:CPA2 family monovalent cation:H+ antiporter-2